MRKTVWLAACAALLVPGAALAEDPCSRTPNDVPATLGEVAGTPEDGRRAYMPTGLQMLGRDVSYVLVMTQGDGGPVEEIAYRIKDASRKAGSPPEASLAKAFDDAFRGGSCAGARTSSCGVAYDPDKTDGFAGAELHSGRLWLEDRRTGPAIALIRADMNMADSAPVFLVCAYEP